MFLEYSALISGIVIKVASLYFTVMCLFFWIRKPAEKTHDPKTRFACLIPARNEAKVIGELVRSLREQDYPADLVEIYVIPNNCTDDTELAARRAGAEIINVRGPIYNKGDVLHQAIGMLLPREDIDCFLLLDADNVADKGFLKAMNDAFLNGAEVTKSRIEAKNPYDSWISGCYGLYYNVFNLFFNESRSRLGLSPKLIGTGLGIKRDVLLRMGGWNTVTIAEDTEFNADCVLAGCKIRWVPKAVTYDEAPEEFGLSLKQRRRWVGGIMAVAKERSADLLRGIGKGRRARQLFDMFMILSMPYVQVASLIPLLLTMAAGIAYGKALTVLLVLLAGTAVSCAGVMLFALVLAVMSPYKTLDILKSVLMFPVFAISWMPLSVLAFFGGAGVWEQIRHQRAVGVRELNYIR